MKRGPRLLALHRAMLEALGPSHWWPGESPFEVMVGAILTQNTSWANVAKAIATLRAADLLDPERLDAVPVDELAELIRPAGYFRLKAGRLKHFLGFLRESGYDLPALAARDTAALREDLLAVTGIGPETADSILLYALGHPVFVVDAYTRRIASRHGLVPEDIDYHELQSFFADALPPDAALFNEYHALLVRVGHGYCRKSKPDCAACPLQPFLEG
jgi:endonuclease-3 related protein